MADQSVELAWYDPPYNVGKDYGATYNDDRPDEEYLGFMARVIAETKRVARAVCVFVPTKYGLWYWNQLGPDYKQIILTWSPEGAFRGGFINQFSFLLTNAKPVRYTKNVWHNCQTPGLGWFFREETYGHPGYTSEDITARVIHCFTNEGDMIVDPFFGTGTTGVCAERYNRKWIGFEVNPDYVSLANRRIEIQRTQGALVYLGIQIAK